MLLRDSAIVTWRNVVNLRRIPDAVVAATLQPMSFLLLFAFVFGDSLGGVGYREWLIGGMLAQSVAFTWVSRRSDWRPTCPARDGQPIPGVATEVLVAAHSTSPAVG